MPRDTIQRTQRVQVEDAQDAFSYRPVAQSPLQAAASASGGGLASGLAKALGVAGKFAADQNVRMDENARKQAALDYNSGTDVILEEKRKAYRDTYEAMDTRAKLITDEAVWAQEIRDSGVSTPEELDALIDEKASIYKGVDPKSPAADVLIDRLSKFRVAQQEELIARTVVDLNNEGQANIMINAEADYTSGEFNHVALHSNIRTLFPTMTNDLYFAIVKDIAVRNGDPTLLENIPDRWEDGTPTVKHIPAYNDKMLAAQQQAQNVRDAQDKAEAKRLKDELEARQEATATDGYSMALEGVDPTDFVLEQAGEGNLTGKMANAIVQAYRSAENYDAKTSRDPGKAMELTARVLTDPASVTDEELYVAWGEGAFGDPKQPEARQALRTMLKDRDQARKDAKDLATNPHAVAYIDRWRDSYPVKKDPITGAILTPRAEMMFMAEMEQKLRSSIANGKQPAEAYREAEEEYLNHIAKVRNADQGGYRNTAEALEDLTSGKTGARETILGLRSVGVPSAQIHSDLRRAKESGSITNDQFLALLTELDQP